MEYEDEVGEVVDSFAMNLVDLIGRNGRVEWSIVSSEDPSRSSERDKVEVEVFFKEGDD